MKEKRSGLWRITLDTNPDDCNYHCIMCEEHSVFNKVKRQKKRRMPLDLLEKTLKQAVSLGVTEVIPSTMGEPLLYKHFNTIIDYCREYHLKLNLTTNGSFVRLGVEKWAELLLPVLSDIKISWNSTKPETQHEIMAGSKYEQMNSNLLKFIEYRNAHFQETGQYVTITLQMTFLEKNYKELTELVKMAFDYRIDRLKGHHLWAHFSEIKNLSMRKDKEAVRRWNNEVKSARALSEKLTESTGHTVRLDNIFEIDNDQNYMITEQAECPFLGKEAWVSAEGRFSPCCAPDEERQKLGDFGSLYEKSLSDIWFSNQYSNLAENYKSYDLCTGCNMRRP